MKKILIVLILFFILINTIACDNSSKVEELTPYEVLYNGNSTSKHELVPSGALNRASYGYKFNDVQGYNGWEYIYKKDVIKQMSFENNAWKSEYSDTFNDGVFSVVGANQVGYAFNISNSGLYEFNGTFKKALVDSTPITLEIYKNDTKIFPQESFEVDCDDLTGKYFYGSVECDFSDKLYFLITGTNAYLNPAITKENNLNYSLYTTHTDWGFYGDLHTYYYENKVYMYHLWNHNFTGEQWEWNMQTTTDMFRYKNSGYDASFVKNHYMDFSRTPDLLDYDQYISKRDYTLFYDSDIDRYRYIALAYRQNDSNNISCDLAMRVSDDSAGMEWTKPMTVLRSFPNTKAGEPECSAFRKIGNRWYLYTGISKQTVHHVGTLTYFIGDEGKNIDEVDWSSLEPHYLDGEDLCVPQIEQIGNRFYLYGWMPRVYNSGYWGGYKNLSREVFVRADGTLGTRIDEMATKLLNKGKYLDINGINTFINDGSGSVNDNNISFDGTNNIAQVDCDLESSFVTFDVSLNESKKVSYLMFAEQKEFEISIIKEDDGIYLEISCPKDVSHPISSRILFSKNSINDFKVKIIIDGGIIEFCVNDELVLTGRTAMKNKVYNAGFYADSNASFKNIEINRLAQFYDIYD